MLLVVIAIDVLDMGESGVGILTAAFGVGGILGATAGVSLVGRGRLGRPFQLALVGWGLPLVALAAWPEPWVAIVCLAMSGLANSLLDVAGFTIMQENTDERVIGRIFGLFELVVIATVGLGSLLAPVAIDLLGSRGALIAAAGLLALLAVLATRGLGRIDDEADRGPRRGARASPADVDLRAAALRGAAAVGGVAGRAPRRPGHRDRPAGRGGDIVFVIAEGRASVSRDGDVLRQLGPDDVFGELALILDVPRTATVTATEPLVLRTLAREPFLAAVTGNQLSGDELRRIVASRTPAELAGSPR